MNVTERAHERRGGLRASSALSFLSAIVLALTAAPPAAAQAGSRPGSQPSLTYIDGSSVKLEQIIGDKDWADAANGINTPTPSQTITRYDVEGTDLGASFELDGKLTFLFGDTIGTKTKYNAHDTMAWSTTVRPEDRLLINFFTNSDGSTLLVEPKFPDGTFLPMGADDVPNAGISLAGGIYIVCNSGSDTTLSNPHAHDYSVLVRFDETTNRFYAGRTISSIPGGHFIITSLHELPPEFGISGLGPGVLMYGLGAYRATDVYLAVIPASELESGKGTRYFAGLNQGQPTWADLEASAAPVVIDNPSHHVPPAPPSIGNASVAYSGDLGLWLMTYDGGRQIQSTTGVYFSYAPAPWGPWSEPQLIFNVARDHGLGVFIHDPGFNPPGPAGPTINEKNNPPATTRGGDYAPYMMERFTEVVGDTLNIYYTLSTWNPYTVVKMRSAFKITRDQTVPLCGDLNGNGKIDVGDATLALRIAVQLAAATGAQGAAACGHSFDIGFATMILRSALGLSPTPGPGLAASMKTAAPPSTRG